MKVRVFGIWVDFFFHDGHSQTLMYDFLYFFQNIGEPFPLVPKI